MFGNNLAFFTLWWVLFDRFETFGDWRLNDMLTLYGVVAGGWGTSIVFGGGARRIARYVLDGELDSLLIQPKPVLLHAVGSSSTASGWGDLVTGVLMLY